MLHAPYVEQLRAKALLREASVVDVKNVSVPKIFGAGDQNETDSLGLSDLIRSCLHEETIRMTRSVEQRCCSYLRHRNVKISTTVLNRCAKDIGLIEAKQPRHPGASRKTRCIHSTGIDPVVIHHLQGPQNRQPETPVCVLIIARLLRGDVEIIARVENSLPAIRELSKVVPSIDEYNQAIGYCAGVIFRNVYTVSFQIRIKRVIDMGVPSLRIKRFPSKHRNETTFLYRSTGRFRLRRLSSRELRFCGCRTSRVLS